MKQVLERPTEGQWVEMWEFNNEIWCNTYRKNDTGDWQVYNSFEDSYETVPSLPSGGNTHNITYWVAE